MSQQLIRDALRASPQATKESIARDLAPAEDEGKAATFVRAITKPFTYGPSGSQGRVPSMTSKIKRTDPIPQVIATTIAPIIPGPPAPPVDTEMEGEKPISREVLLIGGLGIGVLVTYLALRRT